MKKHRTNRGAMALVAVTFMAALGLISCDKEEGGDKDGGKKINYMTVDGREFNLANNGYIFIDPSIVRSVSRADQEEIRAVVYLCSEGVTMNPGTTASGMEGNGYILLLPLTESDLRARGTRSSFMRVGLFHVENSDISGMDYATSSEITVSSEGDIYTITFDMIVGVGLPVKGVFRGQLETLSYQDL